MQRSTRPNRSFPTSLQRTASTRWTSLLLACLCIASAGGRVGAESPVPARPSWRELDAAFAYDGPLGAELHEDGSATLRLWSPLAASVEVVLYDRHDSDRIIRDAIAMARHATGTWTVTLEPQAVGLPTLRGAFYHFRIDARGDGTTRLALDPYAKSMALFDSSRHETGKAAIVDPSRLGPTLAYATIPGFSKREDAVIWEVHVRDFTVDPAIAHELTAPFGTFEAVIDRLDYVRALGVTHIQLLPVMSFREGDESRRATREMHYSARGNNYNWGYDPHSYFSLSGMYSAEPEDPERRIVEFKRLVEAIHQRGMGVILDVVFNHTARLEILEDLAPGYYHFMDADGTPRTSFGGGRLGTTHAMARRILVDSIVYWTREFKVDGFRFDMMGDHDAASIQAACDAARALNPDILIIGEGWRTYAGDEGDRRQAADQDWMAHTDAVGVFSDEFRNEIKSGYGNEGEPRFISGGARSIRTIFDNIRAQPGNFHADDPGDVVTYIEAHDNLTLHDVLAYSAGLDPEVPESRRELHRRIRLGNALVLTSQGIAFLHAGQEYGRTKQWLAPGQPEHKETRMVDRTGRPFVHPFFVHDSFDSSDAVNRFDWVRATDRTLHPEATLTRAYTAGLIALRRSTEAFRLGTRAAVDAQVDLVTAPEIQPTDLVIAYRARAANGKDYFVLINADSRERTLTPGVDLTRGRILVDDDEAGPVPVTVPTGLTLTSRDIVLAPLTAVVIEVDTESGASPAPR